MRKPHRKQRLAWLLTAVLLLTHLPVSVLSEEIIENSIQTEIVEQNESGTAEEPNLSDFPTEEPDEPIEPPVSEEPNETPEPSEPSGTMEIHADENTPDIPDQDESETPEPSDSDSEFPVPNAPSAAFSERGRSSQGTDSCLCRGNSLLHYRAIIALFLPKK